MTKVEKLKRKIDELNVKIRAIQSECPHPSDKVVKEHHSDTGNYCQQDDRYWTEFKCSTCQKYWEEEGSK